MYEPNEPPGPGNSHFLPWALMTAISAVLFFKEYCL